ncbi:MAG: sodium/proline symporter PutP [Succinivibrionaceae bacterium]
MITTTTTFIVYIFSMLVIGLIAARTTSSLSDYVLGGRRLGKLITGLSAGASDMSGWLLMGLPGALFSSGLSQAWIAIGLTIGQWCNWKFVAARLRSFTANASNSLTLPDYFASRFNDTYRITAIVSALIILIFFVVYCASGMVSGAKLFEQTFGLDYSNALIIGAASTILYVFIGGFIAVSWTDAVQATLMIFALIVTPIVILTDIGSLDLANQLISQKDTSMTNIIKDTSIIGLISLAGWGLGYVGQPHILVRFMASSTVHGLVGARRISISWMIFCLLGSVLVGYYGVAFAAVHPEINIKDPEQIFIIVTNALFSPWLAGILLSAILAAIMSTLSCQLLVASSTLTADFYAKLIRKTASQKELLWVSRIMLLLVAAVAIIIASNPKSVVLQLVSYAWAGFGASFGPVVVISLFYRKMTLLSAIIGMIVGASTVILWELYQPYNLYSLVPAFAISSISIFWVSSLTQNMNKDVEKLFVTLNNKYKKELENKLS